MSLVDLPGMTRVPVQGQPENIPSKLRALIMAYISNPSCIILAVSAANADLANSDAIALAREADPEGARTIGASPVAIPLQPHTERGPCRPPPSTQPCCAQLHARRLREQLKQIRLRFCGLRGVDELRRRPTARAQAC